MLEGLNVRGFQDGLFWRLFTLFFFLFYFSFSFFWGGHIYTSFATFNSISIFKIFSGLAIALTNYVPRAFNIPEDVSVVKATRLHTYAIYRKTLHGAARKAVSADVHMVSSFLPFSLNRGLTPVQTYTPVDIL